MDKQARFPAETIEALRSAGVLSAPVPTHLGGAGCNMQQLTQLCATLSQGCGSSGMVLAMHTIQVACIVRHTAGNPRLEAYLREESQLLVTARQIPAIPDWRPLLANPLVNQIKKS